MLVNGCVYARTYVYVYVPVCVCVSVCFPRGSRIPIDNHGLYLKIDIVTLYVVTEILKDFNIISGRNYNLDSSVKRGGKISKFESTFLDVKQ